MPKAHSKKPSNPQGKYPTLLISILIVFFSDSSETETTKKHLKKGTKKVLRRQDFFREFEVFKKDKRK